MSTPPFLKPPSRTRCDPVAIPTTQLATWVLDPVDEPRGTAYLIPGFTGSKEDFVAVLQPLAAQGWRVVTYDQRGQYESRGTSRPYTLSSFAAEAAALIHATKAGPVHVVGHSFGGLVAQQLVLDEPGLAATLTLLCTGPGAYPGDRADALVAFAAATESLPIESVWAAKLAWDTAHGWQLPGEPDLAAFLHNRFVTNDPRSLAAIAHLLVEAPDQIEELGKVAPPALVAYGVTDDAWPLQLQDEMAARLGARLEVIPDAGHSPAAENPQATSALLSSFWSEDLDTD